MKKAKQWELLRLFGEELEGEATEMSVHAPQTAVTGDMEESAPAAGGTETKEGREEEFRALMEGEYKDLFTAYFQETFNRRFRERKEEIEELARAKKVLQAAAEYFGVGDDELMDAIRAENEKKRAPTDTLSENHPVSGDNKKGARAARHSRKKSPRLADLGALCVAASCSAHLLRAWLVL